ncbi:hypothetical protein [Parasphingopyxis sp.]|uniref:hypothetical protein n=1 Tax=Parasphingopyxis sp. TaxID=1920299 RepID=UPI00262F2552|nr:hypothetical protein [Parasphingopyxis sp.]
MARSKGIAAALVTGALVLTACSAGAEDETGLTGAEERQLDEAAAALDEAQAEYEAAIQAAEPEPQAETEE